MAVAAAAMMADSLHGAAITWGPASDIAGDTDVINTGALVYAYEWGTMPSTINGVSFTSSYTVNGGTNVFFVPNSLDSGSTYFSSSSPPFSALSSAYITILEGAVYVAAGNPFSVEVTLANLTIGRKYAVQVWVNDPRGPYNDRSETITSPGGNTVTLDFSTNALNKAGGPGQYTVGTFTADATNQTFTLMGNPAAYVTQLNALQVRDVGTQTLPAWTGINPAGAGAVQLIFQGASGGEYTVLTTTDISTPIANWTPLPNGAGIFGGIAITNISPATNKARFYRIRSP